MIQAKRVSTVAPEMHVSPICKHQGGVTIIKGGQWDQIVVLHRVQTPQEIAELLLGGAVVLENIQ
jgi:hypothetical protein